MIGIKIDQGQLNRLEASLGNAAKKLPREVKTVINAVSRKVALDAARDLSKVMPLKIGSLKKILRQKTKADNNNLSATVGLAGGWPVPLKLHKPTQLKRGVTVKLRRGVARSVIRDAFIVKQYGGHVFMRAGKNRYPLRRQDGPQPKRYFGELRIVEKALSTAQSELVKQMERRIKFNNLKSAGVI